MTSRDSAAGGELPVQQEADRFFDTPQLGGNLKRRSVRGGAITALAQGSKFALQTASMVCLARLLTPADFGLIAMVTAITGLMTLFKDLGLSMATVQRPKINHAQVSTLFWINIAISTVLCALTAALAPAIAWLYGDPRLTTISLALAAGFIFGGLTVQHQAILRRNMRFRALALVDISAMALSVAVAIAAAALGLGYWALVIMQLTLPVTTALGVWVACPWRPGPPSRGVGVRSMLVFGGYLTGFNVVNYFARNLDNALIGWRWGAGPLGLYSRAYSLLLLPIQQVTPAIAAVAVPTLSRLSNEPERYRAFYLRALSLLTFVTTPLAVLLLVCAEETVAVFLGPAWRGAAPIFRMLGFSALLQPTMNSAGWLYMSGGRSSAFFYWGAAASTVIIASFLVGLPYGPKGVALSYSIAVVLLSIPCMHFAVRDSRIRLWDIVQVNLPTLAGGGLSAAAALAFKLTIGRQLAPLPTLAACSATVGIIHVFTVFYAFNQRGQYQSVLRELRLRRATP